MPPPFTTAQLRELDRQHVWHPFTPMSEYAREEIPIITEAEGFTLVDSEGRRYLDGTSALWCNVHGYRVPEIDAAVRAQLDKVAHTTLLGLGGEPSIRLARELTRRTPGDLQHVFFSDDGSTAIEAAVKMVHQHHRQKERPEPQRSLFVSLSQAYHGDTLGAVSLGGIATFHGAYRPLLFETLQLPSPVALRTPEGTTREAYLAECFAAAERLFATDGERIAGLIVEPLVQAAAGMLVHPPGYLKHLRTLTAAQGVPLILDEVAVGFGRTGTLFACEREGVAPDVLCLSKGLTAGYLPLAATLVTPEIYRSFLGEPGAGKTFYHGHTFTGNALACSAALASLELFDERRVLDNAHALTDVLRDELTALREHPHVAEVRQCGVMVGVELVASRTGCVPFPTEQRVGHRVFLNGLERGIFIRPIGDVVVLMPAPAMPPELARRLCQETCAAIDSVTGHAS